MLRKLRSRITYANVVATMALFVALGGTSAYALSGSNTVFSDDIANDNFNSPTEGQGGLVASDLRAGSVTSSEVADGSLTGADVFNNTISGADITNGSLTGADVFDNTLGGADITNGSISGSDVAFETLGGVHIQNGTVSTFDIGDEGVGPDDIADGSLNDDDISQGTFVDFEATINRVPAHGCSSTTITGVDAAGDHLVLTPRYTAPDWINFTAEHVDDGTVEIKACGHADFGHGPFNAIFNLLVIDAQ